MTWLSLYIQCGTIRDAISFGCVIEEKLWVTEQEQRQGQTFKKPLK